MTHVVDGVRCMGLDGSFMLRLRGRCAIGLLFYHEYLLGFSGKWVSDGAQGGFLQAVSKSLVSRLSLFIIFLLFSFLTAVHMPDIFLSLHLRSCVFVTGVFKSVGSASFLDGTPYFLNLPRF